LHAAQGGDARLDLLVRDGREGEERRPRLQVPRRRLLDAGDGVPRQRLLHGRLCDDEGGAREERPEVREAVQAERPAARAEAAARLAGAPPAEPRRVPEGLPEGEVGLIVGGRDRRRYLRTRAASPAAAALCRGHARDAAAWDRVAAALLPR